MRKRENYNESMRVLEILSEFLCEESDHYIKSDAVRKTLTNTFKKIYNDISEDYENYIENIIFEGISGITGSKNSKTSYTN